MRIVVVTFEGSNKQYEYFTDIPLIKGGKYFIVADKVKQYLSPVTVLGYKSKNHQIFEGNLRTITNAKCIKAPAQPDNFIDKVYFNEEKRTTVVIWKDGVKTIVKCAPDDVFSKEAGLALCYMKRAHNNRGCFNETLKRYAQ